MDHLRCVVVTDDAFWRRTIGLFLLCEVIFVCLSLVGEWLLGILPGVISGSAVEELLGAWMCVRPALQHRLVGGSRGGPLTLCRRRLFRGPASEGPE